MTLPSCRSTHDSPFLHFHPFLLADQHHQEDPKRGGPHTVTAYWSGRLALAHSSPPGGKCKHMSLTSGATPHTCMLRGLQQTFVTSDAPQASAVQTATCLVQPHAHVQWHADIVTYYWVQD